MEKYLVVPSQHTKDEAIAAIDLGSNSAHLVVAQLLPSGSLKIIDSEKAPLRLGQALDKNNRLSKEAIVRTVMAMKNFQQVSKAYTKWIRAVATHATREAENHDELLSSIYAATGIEVEIIDGDEEARLSYLGMRNGLALDQELVFGCDIGGGSTEITIAKADDIRFVSSLKMGAVVFNQKFFENTPPDKNKIDAMRRHIQSRLIPISRDILSHKISRWVATSGTAKAIANIHARMIAKQSPSDVNGYTFSTDDLYQIVKQLIKFQTPEKIKAEFGIDQSRSEIIIAGAIILESISQIFEIKKWQVCTFGLREGLVVDTHHRAHGQHKNHNLDIRWRSVSDFGKKFHVDTNYVHHVCDLVSQIYNQTASQLCKDFEEDELISNPDLLHAAAYLHEVGKQISYQQHHKHSYYILNHASLLGFTQRERQMIALIVRYHRKNAPSEADEWLLSHFHLNFKRLCVLSGILRLATALDRTRKSLIQQVTIKINKEDFLLKVDTASKSDAEVELRMAYRERKALQKCFGLKLKIDALVDLE